MYQRILALPGHFLFAGVLARARAKHATHGIPEGLLYESPEGIAKLRADVVVDALPGIEPSMGLCASVSRAA